MGSDFTASRAPVAHVEHGGVLADAGSDEDAGVRNRIPAQHLRQQVGRKLAHGQAHLGTPRGK